MAKKLPVIVSRRNGREYLKSKPLTVKQTPATKRTAASFGKTSSLAAQVIACYKPLIAMSKGLEIYRRFFTALTNWIYAQYANPQHPQQHTNYFNGFRFVPKAGIGHRFKIAYEVLYLDNKIVVNIPAFIPCKEILAPAQCSRLRLKIMAVSCLPFTGELLGCDNFEKEISYTSDVHEALQVNVNVAMPPNSLTLLAVSLRYDCIAWGAAAKAGDMAWMPGGIVSSYFFTA